jgi:hypothetical protein
MALHEGAELRQWHWPTEQIALVAKATVIRQNASLRHASGDDRHAPCSDQE